MGNLGVIANAGEVAQNPEKTVKIRPTLDLKIRGNDRIRRKVVYIQMTIPTAGEIDQNQEATPQIQGEAETFSEGRGRILKEADQIQEEIKIDNLQINRDPTETAADQGETLGRVGV